MTVEHSMKTTIIDVDCEYTFNKKKNELLASGWQVLSPLIHTSERPTSGWAKNILCHRYAQTFFKYSNG